MDDHTLHPDVSRLLGALHTYRAARNEFLKALGCDSSNRDPFAEFAERIATAALGGHLAESRTQKGWDFMTVDGQRVQVRYLANPLGTWVNGHVVDFRGNGCDLYALVVFEGLDVKSLLVFDKERITEVGAALGKWHPGQEEVLQLTQSNYRTIVAEQPRFADLGVQVVDLEHGTAYRRQ